MFSELADQFVESMPEWLSQLRVDAKQGDDEGVRRNAHKLLGVCRQIGAQRMAQLCSELQQSSGVDHFIEKIENLDREFAAAQRELSGSSSAC